VSEPGASALTCRDRSTLPNVIGYFLAGWRLDDSQSEAVRAVLDGGMRQPVEAMIEMQAG